MQAHLTIIGLAFGCTAVHLVIIMHPTRPIVRMIKDEIVRCLDMPLVPGIVHLPDYFPPFRVI